MSGSVHFAGKNMRFSYAFVLLLVFPCGLTRAQEAEERRAVETASALLRSFYPDLGKKEAWTELSFVIRLSSSPDPTDFNSMGITVWDRHSEASKPDSRDRLFTAHLMLDSGGLIESFAGARTLSHYRMRRFGELVARRPNWSKEEDSRALTRAGARYGPSNKRSFLKNVPWKVLERWLGPFRVRTTSFEYSEGHGERSCWALHVLRQRPGEAPHTYFLLFEPFEGELIEVGRMPGPN